MPLTLCPGLLLMLLALVAYWVGVCCTILQIFFLKPTVLESAAINMALVFCMGSDLQSLVNSNQPMAQIFLNAFGLEATLAIWAIVIIVQ